MDLNGVRVHYAYRGASLTAWDLVATTSLGVEGVFCSWEATVWQQACLVFVLQLAALPAYLELDL